MNGGLAVRELFLKPFPLIFGEDRAVVVGTQAEHAAEPSVMIRDEVGESFFCSFFQTNPCLCFMTFQHEAFFAFRIILLRLASGCMTLYLDAQYFFVVCHARGITCLLCGTIRTMERVAVLICGHILREPSPREHQGRHDVVGAEASSSLVASACNTQQDPNGTRSTL